MTETLKKLEENRANQHQTLSIILRNLVETNFIARPPRLATSVAISFTRPFFQEAVA